MNEDPQPTFRWTERRAARLVTILISAAVVVADVALFFVFIERASGLPGGWKQYWYIPGGIFAVLVFATMRLVRNVESFRRDE
jgi:hypothetical protein